MTRVKICGITNMEDALLAVECGADALGFVLEPSSPRCVRDTDLLEDWLADLPPYVFTVAVFGPPRDIRLPVGIHAVQCVGTMANRPGPGIKVVYAARVQSGAVPADAVGPIPSGVHAVLLDSFDAAKYGGTGEPCDWHVASELRERLHPMPVILAGGLNSENVAEAIGKVKPFAVDVASGVEASPGRKDPEKLKRFCAAVRQADVEWGP